MAILNLRNGSNYLSTTVELAVINYYGMIINIITSYHLPIMQLATNGEPSVNSCRHFNYCPVNSENFQNNFCDFINFR